MSGEHELPIASVVRSSQTTPAGRLGQLCTDVRPAGLHLSQPVRCSDNRCHLLPTPARTSTWLASLSQGAARSTLASIKLALEGAGMSDNIGGEDFASGPGVLARAAKCPVTIFVTDEFGDLIGTIGSTNAASHERSIMTIFKKLFGSTQGIYRGTEYANQKSATARTSPVPTSRSTASRFRRPSTRA